eukprot:GHVR01111943.1.p1 GENE.GHVR01111943.1~~GHVR01111943.1.p1  ORF type:complete len:135 (+),score=2.09 GHVR01111943.1:285-689(+)
MIFGFVCRQVLRIGKSSSRQIFRSRTALADKRKSSWFKNMNHLVDITTQMQTGKLVWLPAPKSHRATGAVKLRNGSRLTCVDWRANGLVAPACKGGEVNLGCWRVGKLLLRTLHACKGLICFARSQYSVNWFDD